MIKIILAFLICVLLLCNMFAIAIPALLITYLKVVGLIWLVLTILDVILNIIERSA
jgi:hypothetical protein